MKYTWRVRIYMRNGEQIKALFCTDKVSSDEVIREILPSQHPANERPWCTFQVDADTVVCVSMNEVVAVEVKAP